jgi:membrane associated rhomboid family serine protease
MTSGADLFVVCKQCGSEVSPYITECPYCGHRLRRRAPKLPRARDPRRSPRARGRLRSLLLPSRRLTPRALRHERLSFGSAIRPNLTILIVTLSCASWVAWHAEPVVYLKMVVFGPLHGDWWKLFTSQFAYHNGYYAFATLLTIGIFGWLIERRQGPVVVLALFLGAGAAGALVALAVYPFPVVSGGNAGALALLGAWAAPDIQSARRGSYYDGDLIGAAVIGAVLLALPWAQAEASWLAGVTGAAVGLAAGLGLHRLQETEL